MPTVIKRLISGIALLLTTLTLILRGGSAMYALFIAAGAVAIFEWFKLCVHSAMPRIKSDLLFSLGVGYILIAGWGFYQLRFVAENFGFPSAALQLLLVGLVTVTDTAAYFSGKIFKGPKLAPAVSPNKTWAGALGGLTGALVFGWATLQAYGLSLKDDPNFIKIYLAACLCGSIVGQVGDLLESFAKRYFHVKDTGNLIPGHGGVLDRLDSLLAVSFTTALLLLLTLG